jgi:hypothetical protein
MKLMSNAIGVDTTDDNNNSNNSNNETDNDNVFDYVVKLTIGSATDDDNDDIKIDIQANDDAETDAPLSPTSARRQKVEITAEQLAFMEQCKAQYKAAISSIANNAKQHYFRA